MKRQPAIGSQYSSKRGYSLVEIMVASVVLIMILVSSITALQAGFKMVDDARMASLANQAMQSQLESIKLLNYSYIGGSPGNWYFQSKQFSTNLTSATTAAISGGAKGISFLPQISTVLGNASQSQTSRFTQFDLIVKDWSITNIKEVRVIVSWKGLGNNQVFTREFVTLYAQDGINDFLNSGGI